MYAGRGRMGKKAIMMKVILWNMAVLLATGFDGFRFLLALPLQLSGI